MGHDLSWVASKLVMVPYLLQGLLQGHLPLPSVWYAGAMLQICACVPEGDLDFGVYTHIYIYIHLYIKCIYIYDMYICICIYEPMYV